MICYRSVATEFGTIESLFSGVGAAMIGGRWSAPGIPAIYTSLSLEVSAAERAFHSVLPLIKIYNDSLRDKGSPTKATYEDIIRSQFKVGKIEVSDSDLIIDLTDQATLDHWTSQISLPRKTVQESRHDEFERDPWTESLGTYLNEQGIPGIIVPSARSNASQNLVFFEENLKALKVEILDISDLILTAVSSSGTRLQKGMQAAANQAHFDSSFGNGVATVLKF